MRRPHIRTRTSNTPQHRRQSHISPHRVKQVQIQRQHLTNLNTAHQTLQNLRKTKMKKKEERQRMYEKTI